MVNNLENKIFLFLGINKFTIVAINSTNEFIYKGETLINNQNNQIELDFLDNFLEFRLPRLDNFRLLCLFDFRDFVERIYNIIKEN